MRRGICSTVHNYRPQTQLREGNVFTGVCLSTARADRVPFPGHSELSNPTRIAHCVYTFEGVTNWLEVWKLHIAGAFLLLLAVTVTKMFVIFTKKPSNRKHSIKYQTLSLFDLQRSVSSLRTKKMYVGCT